MFNVHATSYLVWDFFDTCIWVDNGIISHEDWVTIRSAIF